MIISRTMNLDDLADRMGRIATGVEAQIMRAALVAHFDGRDTNDVPEYHWDQMLALVAAEVA